MGRLAFYLLLLCLTINLSSQSLLGQTEIDGVKDYSTLAEAITEKGYQNVMILTSAGQLSVYYENRVQRFEPRAIIDIIRLIAKEELEAEVEEIHLIAQRLQIPVLTVLLKNEDLKNWRDGIIVLEEFVATLQVKQGGLKLPKRGSIVNTGNFRIELEIKPEIGLGLGGFPDPVIHRFFLLPTINLFLWKGAQIKSEFILPISSEFNIVGEQVVRPGILSFSQTIQPFKQLWLQASLGYFSNNRFGGRLSFAKYLFNGSLALTGRVGYTGYASYPRKLNLEEAMKGWEYSEVDYYDYNIGLNYWFDQWNTQIRLEYGQELFYKKQLKFTCLQRFNEVDMGFFALKTQRGNNYGMILNIPIAPKKYWKPKKISIRPAQSLDYYYQATQATVESYETGLSIIDLNRQLNPAFIKNQLLLYQDGRKTN